MNKRTRQRPSTTGAPVTAASDTTQATADLGSNAQRQEQLDTHGDGGADASMLDQVEAQQGERLKLNGFGEITSDRYFGGEPAWVANDSWSWFEDGMEVTGKDERSAEDAQWESPSSSLGYVLTGPQVHAGGWATLTEETPSGDYTLEVEDQELGKNLQYTVSYRAARRREGVLDRYQDAEGNKSMQWYLARYTQGVSKVIGDLTSTRDLFEAGGGRKLDPFSTDFGDELTPVERLVGGTAFLAKVLTVGGGAGGAAIMLEGAVLVAKESTSVGADLGVLSPVQRDAVTGFIDLVDLYSTVKDVKGAWTFVDYVTAMGKANSAGENWLKAQYGDEYAEHWKQEQDRVTSALKLVEALASISSGG